jgi:signal transduction histidine kinase
MLWEEYKLSLNEHKNQLEELVQQRTLKLSQEIHLRKQTEQKLLQANQMKDKILNVLTLDLRSPLSNIVMNLRFLNENITNCTDDTQQQINDAYNEARNTWQLTENIFHWARTQKGEIVNHPEKYHLKSILNDTLLFYSKSIENKNIDIDLQVDDNIEIYTDRKIVYTIIQNVISNAVKYCNMMGKILITACDDKDSVVLQITDNGVGIPEAVLPFIMDVAKPITTIGTAYEKGSGLGLTICNELSKIIKAGFAIESTVGIGTTVKLTLPKTKSQD